MNRRTLMASLAVLLFLPACASVKTEERSRKLTVLAAKEAGHISDADARLTLQLNIANWALERFDPADGMAIIGEVAKTLRAERDHLRGRTRLSGWVSASQLSRRAKNSAAAAEAAQAAAQELAELSDQAERCQYLLGVAQEVRISQGDAAEELLSKGGEWATAIEDRAERRQARLAFANALLEMSAFDNAVAMLRHEQDAVWASSTLLALASTPSGSSSVFDDRAVGTQSPKLIPEGLAAPTTGTNAYPVTLPLAEADALQQGANQRRPSGYGRPVDFGSVFHNRSNSAR